MKSAPGVGNGTYRTHRTLGTYRACPMSPMSPISPIPHPRDYLRSEYETPTFLPADVLALASTARVSQRAGNAGRLRARRRAARKVSRFGRGRARSRLLDREDQPFLVSQSGQGGIRVRPDGRRDSRQETGVRS